jgi:putative colanic acid biosynthesis acetyltransferase WcaB
MDTKDDSDLPFIRWVLQDWKVNSPNTESQCVLAMFRLTQYLQEKLPAVAALVKHPYRLITSVVMGVELPHSVRIGPRVRIPHPHGIVVHRSVVMGSDCVLRHGVTIGNKASNQVEVPRLGNGVILGAGSVVLGDVDIGDGVTIGALTVVTKSVPAGKTVIGNPARILK